MLPDAGTVSNLHQIVDLGAAPDPGLLHAGPVHAGIGLDFHVVFNDYRRGLKDLVPVAGVVLGEAEAIGPDDSAVLQHYAVAELAAFAYHGMGVGKEVVADSGAAIDDYVRQQHRI